MSERDTDERPSPYLWLAYDEQWDDPMWLLPRESEMTSKIWSDPDIEIQIVWWDDHV